MTTPMMQQYRDAKEKHPGMLLLFRMGDFYELFENDAEVAAKVLGLTLTSRDKAIPMAGFPHHQLDNYLHKLLTQGHRVAVCDQVEDASQAKGLVKREVTRVVTPGTITEDDLLDPRQSNHLTCVFRGNGPVFGLAWVELSTGQFFAMDLAEARLIDELARLAPSECVVSEKHADTFAPYLQRLGKTPALTRQPDWTFDPVTARSALHQHFSITTLAGFGFDDQQPCLIAAGALLHYVRDMMKAELTHLRRLQPYFSHQVLQLDEVTRRSLELTRTLRDGDRTNSLLGAIDRTVTSMGARLLADWLLAPLTELTGIHQRLDAVQEFVEAGNLRGPLRESLDRVGDLQRLTSRVSTGRATPRDLAAIARTLRFLPSIKAKLSARRSTLLAFLESQLELCPDLRELLDRSLVEEPPNTAKEGGVIRPGYHAELDELREIARGGKEWIARFQAQEITRTGISSLKVGFNKVFGYYIEITNTHQAKIPANYDRKQTLKNAERYITPELKEYEEKVLSAEEKIQTREYELFLAIRDQVAAQTHRLLQTGEVLAHLDVLAGLADVALSSDDGNFWLITGPNMAGKSTFIRQVALLTLLAQMGSFVPAKKMNVGVADRIFTRVGASDELSRGQSTFMVEMTEAANILNNASRQSLVILDEIGRGTSTYDGVSLAWAITEFLHTQVGCRSLFATHYHELARLSETLPSLRNYNVLVQEHKEDVVFLHKIAPGSADKSYGIHVARLAGVPPEVLDRARDVLTLLESHHLDEEVPKVKRRRRHVFDVQPLLFQDLE